MVDVANGNKVDAEWHTTGDVTDRIGAIGADGSRHRFVALTAVSATPGVAQYLLIGEDGRPWHTIRNADGSWRPTVDLIAQQGYLAVGERVPEGWRVLTGNAISSLVARVAYRFEIEDEALATRKGRFADLIAVGEESTP